MVPQIVAAASRRDLVADGPAPDIVVPFPEGRASYGAEGGARDGEELPTVGLFEPFLVSAIFVRRSLLEHRCEVGRGLFVVRGKEGT